MTRSKRIVGKDGKWVRVKPVFAVSTKKVPAPIIPALPYWVEGGLFETIIIDGQAQARENK